MSKSMKILVAIAGVLLLAAVVLTMLGKPPNLPLGPLKGALAKDADEAGGDAVTAAPAPATPIAGVNDCPPTGATPPVGSTAPGSGTSAIPPATPGAGAGTGTTTAPGATTPTTPGAGTPVASGVAGASGGDTVVIAAGDGSSWSAVRDTPTLIAADAATPVTPATPAATNATPVDPGAAASPTTPATPGSVTPGAPGVVDCDPVVPSTGATGTGTPAAGTPAAGAAAGAANRATTDGTNTGNSPEALRVAKDAAAVMQKAQITVSVNATLLPGTGGVGTAAQIRAYRTKVTSGSLVITLTDPNAQQQWTTAGKKVQIQLVQSFLQRLSKTFRTSARSVSVIDASGNLLAVGDAVAGRPSGAVKLY